MTIDRPSLLARDPCCLRCAAALGSAWCSWSVHHLRLRSQGGPDVPSNTGGLCGSGSAGCHGWCHAHPRLAATAGWIRRPGTLLPGGPPWSRWPVWCAWRNWVLLDDSYGWRPYIPGDDGPPLPVPAPNVRGS